MTEEMLSVPTPDGEMGAYVRRPDGDGPFPVVVYFHHGPGLDGGSKQSMDLLADAGYYVASHDRYNRHGAWLTFDTKALRSEGPDSEGLRSGSSGSWPGRPTTWSRPTSPWSSSTSPTIPPLAPVGRWAASGSASAPDRSCGRWPTTPTASRPASRSTRRSARPTTRTCCTSPSPASPGRSTSASAPRTRCSRPRRTKPLIDVVVELGERGTVEIHDGADHGFAVPGRAYHPGAADRSYAKALEIFGQAVG